MNAPVDAPAGIVIDAGTVRTAELLVRLTTWAVAAGALSPTEQVAVAPFAITGVPPIEGTLQVTAETALPASMVNAAVCEKPLSAPVKVTAVLAATWVVAAMNVALDAAAAIVSVAGTVAAAELEVSVTTDPAAGAGAERLTVHVLEAPFNTEPGAQLMDETITGRTVTELVLVYPL